jgi:hypothetical protein
LRWWQRFDRKLELDHISWDHAQLGQAVENCLDLGLGQRRAIGKGQARGGLGLRLSGTQSKDQLRLAAATKSGLGGCAALYTHCQALVAIDDTTAVAVAQEPGAAGDAKDNE